MSSERRERGGSVDVGRVHGSVSTRSTTRSWMGCSVTPETRHFDGPILFTTLDGAGELDECVLSRRPWMSLDSQCEFVSEDWQCLLICCSEHHAHFTESLVHADVPRRCCFSFPKGLRCGSLCFAIRPDCTCTVFPHLVAVYSEGHVGCDESGLPRRIRLGQQQKLVGAWEIPDNDRTT